MPRLEFFGPHLPPASGKKKKRNILQPETPGFCVYRQALCSWHFLWQISVTTKGYTVNMRWQILKLACFHNCHFWRGERPFSGTVKKKKNTSRIEPVTIPTLPPTVPCYENVIILFWRSWSGCVSFVITVFFLKETRKNKITKAGARKPFTDQSTMYTHRGGIKSQGLETAQW